MKDTALRRLTGVSALASVAIWLAIFRLYTLGDPAVSLYDGASIALDLFRLPKHRLHTNTARVGLVHHAHGVCRLS
jgi:hypothetical protein